MMSLKKLTSRSTVIFLLSAITASLLEALVLPQRTSTGGKVPEWVGRLPEGVRPLVDWLGLDNVVGSGWFLALIALFGLSLALSTVNQFGAVRTLVTRPPREDAVPDGVWLDEEFASLQGRLESAGYRLSASSGRVHRFVKFRSGYWGNFLLHLGLATAVVFSLVYVATQHRVFMRLVGQESTRLIPGNIEEMHGMFPFQLGLPESVRLTRVEPAFYPNDRLASLGSRLEFSTAPGRPATGVEVALSDKSQIGPFLVYQANAFGQVFDLLVSGAPGGLSQERLFLPYPPGRDKASYGELKLKESGLLLKAKFVADAQKKSMQPREPVLTLRLLRGKELMGQATLRPGETGRLGPLLVQVGQNQWWTDILLDGSRGMSGIFAGFAIILIGVLSSYCLVPREILVREADSGVYLAHVVRRFAHFYREEFEALVKAAGTTGEGKS